MSRLNLSEGAHEKGTEEMHATWLQRAVILIDQGGSEITVINFLSGQGVTPETGKGLGAKLYEEARAIVIRKRLPIFIAGWILVVVGILLPILTWFTGNRAGMAVVAAAPVLLGMGLLQKARVRR